MSGPIESDGASLARVPSTSRRIVHLLDRFDDAVLELLRPTMETLSQSSLDQAVVLVDDARRRRLLTRLDPSIELVLVPPQRDLPARWRALGAAFARALDEQPVQAVHLHGFVASLIGEHAMRHRAWPVPIFYSPHDSLSLRSMRGVAALMRLAASPLMPRREFLAIGHGLHEAKALKSQAAVRRHVQLVEGPIGDAFFEVEPNPARHPLVLASSRAHDARAIETFAQLAVLLGSGALRLAFNWIGPVDEVSAARLRAANVGVFDPGDDAERASRLAAGWVFVALGGDRGFPLALGEAMAAGLPCVAVDSPAYREVVQHGETGYVCRGHPETIDRIAQLIDTPRTRHRMGRTARTVARERFSRESFRAALLAAYQLAGEGEQPTPALIAAAEPGPASIGGPEAAPALVAAPAAPAQVAMSMPAAAAQECS